MRKLLSVLSSTLQGGVRGGLLFLALLATTTLWAYDFQSGDLYYKITSNSAPYTVEVTYQEYDSYSNYHGLTTATIPETVTYEGTTYSVTSIEDAAFIYCSSLTSVTIPNSVTSIGWSAFYECTSLSSVTIPNSVTSIGNNAFWNCSSLTSVTIPNSVTSIGIYAFWNCSSLSSIQIEATTPPTLGNSAFASNLTAIYIPDNTSSAYQQAWGNEYTYVNNETTLTLHVEVPGILVDLIFVVRLTITILPVCAKQ